MARKIDRAYVRRLSARAKSGRPITPAEWREVWDAMPIPQQRRLAKRAREQGMSAMGILVEHPELCVPGAKG